MFLSLVPCTRFSSPQYLPNTTTFKLDPFLSDYKIFVLAALIYRVGSQTHNRYCCLLNHLPGQRPQEDHPTCTSNPKFLPWIPSQVDGLLQHPDFSLTNPNKCRSVISAFAANMKYFHAKDGSGYKWLADRILQVHILSHPKDNSFLFILD